MKDTLRRQWGEGVACLAIPTSVTCIGWNTFRGDAQQHVLEFPASVHHVGRAEGATQTSFAAATAATTTTQFAISRMYVRNQGGMQTLPSVYN